MMTQMMLALNAVLYVVALTMSLCVVTPLPPDATRRVRLARIALACGGGTAITAAITLSFLGMWFESALVGCVALSIVCVCMWIALSHPSSDRDDGEDGSDGGGGRPRRPVPPAPTEPHDGPDLDWGEFDRARAGWSRDRDLIGT
jgi:hypothetical protein